MKVCVDINESTTDGDYGDVPCLYLTCERCGHEVTVYETSDASACRGAFMLRDECPNSESNYYDIGHWEG